MKNSRHCFSVDLATDLGNANRAILLGYFWYLTNINVDESPIIKSHDEIHRVYPYMKPIEILNELKELSNLGLISIEVITVGSFSKLSLMLTEDAVSLCKAYLN